VIVDEHDCYQDTDGTWAIDLEPWTLKVITGIPTKELAVLICTAVDDAMEAYASHACED
jgi:hypothetical protein